MKNTNGTPSFVEGDVNFKRLGSRYVCCVRCASATVDSHNPLVDSVLIVCPPGAVPLTRRVSPNGRLPGGQPSPGRRLPGLGVWLGLVSRRGRLGPAAQG